MSEPRAAGAQPYDAERIARYFDELGELEWSRFEKTALQQVKLEIHLHYLDRFVAPRSHVLEIGAGPGRFTRTLAQMGCPTLVTDVSDVQLGLNRARAEAEGYAHSIVDWRRADVTDLSELGDGGYDVVLAYGGPLSYALDKRRAAASECARVLRPGGLLLASVMSLWGTVHYALESVLEVPAEVNRRIVAGGDITGAVLEGHKHSMHLFRSRELVELLEGAGLDVVALSASNALSTRWEETAGAIREDAARWAHLMELEIQACANPGCVDMGNHIIAVARKPA